MSSGQEEIIFFEAIYHNGSIPPPYNYEFKLQLSLAGGGDIDTRYELTYRFRDEITEQEITEEGFTTDDDFAWEGELPAVWRKEVLNTLDRTTWPRDQKDAAHTEPYIRIFYKKKDGSTFKGVPAETDVWDYFLQELVQGIYELAQKEHFLEIEYLEVTPGEPKGEILFKPVFHMRKALLEVRGMPEKNKNGSREISWNKVKDTLRQIYIPDYNYEQASNNKPSKPGKYIQPGDGFWFKLNESATNPDPDRDAVGDMVRALKSL